jgi:hypothetical protein
MLNLKKSKMTQTFPLYIALAVLSYTLMLTGIRRSSQNCGSRENSSRIMSLRQSSADRRSSSKHSNTQDSQHYRNSNMEQSKEHAVRAQRGSTWQVTTHHTHSQEVSTRFLFGRSGLKSQPDTNYPQKCLVFSQSLPSYGRIVGQTRP